MFTVGWNRRGAATGDGAVKVGVAMIWKAMFAGGWGKYPWLGLHLYRSTRLYALTNPQKGTVMYVGPRGISAVSEVAIPHRAIGLFRQVMRSPSKLWRVISGSGVPTGNSVADESHRVPIYSRDPATFAINAIMCCSPSAQRRGQKIPPGYLLIVYIEPQTFKITRRAPDE